MNQSISQANSTRILCGVFSPSVTTKTSLVVAYIILLVAACVENALVICLARTFKDLKQSPFVYLIINMAVADILDACVATSLSVSFSFVGSRWLPGLFGKISCKLAYFSLVFSIGLSICTLMVMSVDRYLAIVLTMRKPLSGTATKRCIAMCWIIAAITASPYLYKMGTAKQTDGSYHCFATWSYDREQSLLYSKWEESLKFAVFYVIPLLAIASTSTIIAHTLRKRRALGSCLTQASIEQQNHKIFKLLITIVVLFAVCWPFAHVQHLLSAFAPSRYCKLPAYIPMFSYWLSHTIAAVNPIIYFVFNNKFREGLRQALQDWKLIRPRRTRNVIPQENLAFASWDTDVNMTEDYGKIDSPKEWDDTKV